MNRATIAVAVGALALGAAGRASAQGPSGPPILIAVDPPVATIGGETEWSIRGRNFARVESVRVSGAGVRVVAFEAKGDDAAKVRVAVAPDAEPGGREVRLDGAGGMSNLALVRVDRLANVAEVEPNDRPERGQEIAVGTAALGVLKAVDVDHYTIRGAPGARLTIDLEARRIGTAIDPVVTLFDPGGRAFSQGREAPGGDGECRMTATVPAAGYFIAQVRDNTYGGNDSARYRLRVDPAPYATSVFPLGGPRGSKVAVELAGGNLPAPIRAEVPLPDRPGAIVEFGPVAGPGGPVAVPMRLAVGDGPEAVEPADLPLGTVANGRISRDGEVDTYRVAVEAGRRYRVKVEAAGMGSWLDSVVAVRDEKGGELADNDDTAEAISPRGARSVGPLGAAEGSPDSSVEFEANADGVASVAVADRFGDGGPEYGYRLTVTTGRPDLALTILIGGANANAGAVDNAAQARNPRLSPGQFGVFNLKPGASVPVNFLIAPEGRPGPVTVRAEGLPPGVTAEPVTVRFPGPTAPGQPAGAIGSPLPEADSLTLKVAPYAQPGLFEFRVVAAARPTPDRAIGRDALATVGVDGSRASGRPITRVVDRFPLRIVGDARAEFVGPPAPPILRSVRVPGPLLLGDRISLGLEFDHAIAADDGSTLEAEAEGVGLFANTVISAGGSLDADDPAPEATVRVLASPKAKPGPYKIKVTYAPPGGPRSTREVVVDVRMPARLRVAAGDLYLRPGDSLKLPIEVEREPGYGGEVELKVEGLPRGVRLAKGATIPGDQKATELMLEMATTAKPLKKDAEIRVVGVARTPSSSVTLESPNRPILKPRPADK